MKIEKISQLKVCIKGAGEMASAIAFRLFRSNIKKIFMLEIDSPLAVRRQVSFCEVMYENTMTVEGVTASRVLKPEHIELEWQREYIPVLSDAKWKSIKNIQPHVVIDATLAKKNLGTCLNESNLVIGLGPGFEARKDVHIVIETNRGHNLGRLIESGMAEANTGIPGNIEGYTRERVLRAQCDGLLTSDLEIGSLIKSGDTICHVDNLPVKAQIDGVLRGIIRNKSYVKNNMKIGDIDPRGKIEFCSTISEKARSISGSVLEAILKEYNV